MWVCWLKKPLFVHCFVMFLFQFFPAWKRPATWPTLFSRTRVAWSRSPRDKWPNSKESSDPRRRLYGSCSKKPYEFSEDTLPNHQLVSNINEFETLKTDENSIDVWMIWCFLYGVFWCFVCYFVRTEMCQRSFPSRRSLGLWCRTIIPEGPLGEWRSIHLLGHKKNVFRAHPCWCPILIIENMLFCVLCFFYTICVS